MELSPIIDFLQKPRKHVLEQSRGQGSRVRPILDAAGLTCVFVCARPFPFRRRYAIDRNAPVVSNDRFRDHSANDDTLGSCVYLWLIYSEVRYRSM